MAINPRITRSTESSRSQRIVDTMRIIAQGVTHRDGGGLTALANSIGATNITIGNILDKIRGLSQQPISLNIGSLETINDDHMIPLATPGPRGKQGLPGKQGPPGMDFMGDGLDIPLQIPGQRGRQGLQGKQGPSSIDVSIDILDIPVGIPGPKGAKGNTGATGATGATGSSGTALPTGLSLWLVAQDLVDAGAADASSVSPWHERIAKDKNDATEATNKPIIKTSIINSLAVVRFDGTNDQLAIPDRTYWTPNNFDQSVFMVAQKTAAATADNIAGKAGTLYEWSAQNTTGSKMQITYYQTAGATHAAVTTTTGIVDNSPFIFAFTYEYLVKVSAWLNGGTKDTSTSFSGTMTDSSETIKLGQRGDASGNGFWAGDIAEVIMFNRVLTPAEVNTVIAYLGTKYGITVTTAT